VLIFSSQFQVTAVLVHDSTKMPRHSPHVQELSEFFGHPSVGLNPRSSRVRKKLRSALWYYILLTECNHCRDQIRCWYKHAHGAPGPSLGGARLQNSEVFAEIRFCSHRIKKTAEFTVDDFKISKNHKNQEKY
jgi:hypothetical protein